MRFTPHDYQRFAIDFIKEHTNAAVFLDMGLGKTVITLTALDDLLFDSFEVLPRAGGVPAAGSQDHMAAGDCEMGSLAALALFGGRGHAQGARRRAEQTGGTVHHQPGENVEWLVKHYAGRKLPFDMLVIDELSSFKNSRAKRFLALKKVLGQFTRVIGLTGTPRAQTGWKTSGRRSICWTGALAWAGRCAAIWTCTSTRPTAGCLISAS